ncbi:hypothetical protein BDF19DRAFT_414174 [Syncephalis fuscata]|nr:hypothetical protein BDF19DRAFT_414174 [Syncephalis fuscata]
MYNINAVPRLRLPSGLTDSTPSSSASPAFRSYPLVSSIIQQQHSSNSNAYLDTICCIFQSTSNSSDTLLSLPTSYESFDIATASPISSSQDLSTRTISSDSTIATNTASSVFDYTAIPSTTTTNIHLNSIEDNSTMTTLPIVPVELNDHHSSSDMMDYGKTSPFLLTSTLHVETSTASSLETTVANSTTSRPLPLPIVLVSRQRDVVNNCYPEEFDTDETDTDNDSCGYHTTSTNSSMTSIKQFAMPCQQFSLMPREIRLHIFRHLPKADLLNVYKVCHDWRALALDGCHWVSLDIRGWRDSITDIQLQVIANTAGSFMRHVNLRGCMQLQSSTLKTITLQATNLESLTLTGCRGLTPSAISLALTLLPNLRQLDLSGLTAVTEGSLSHFNAPLLESVGNQLHTLHMAGCERAVNDNLLAKLGQRHLQLDHLDIADCNTVTNTGIEALALGCRQLTKLSMSKCIRIGDAGVSAIGTSCPLLTHLDLSNCGEITSQALVVLSRGCPELTQLDLEECTQISDEGLHAIAVGCSNLQSVALGHCNSISDDGVFALIAKCSQLKCLAIDNCESVSSEVLTRLNASTEQIDVFDCRLITETACTQATLRAPHLQVRSSYPWLAGVERRRGAFGPMNFHNRFMDVIDGIGIGGPAHNSTLVGNCTIL